MDIMELGAIGELVGSVSDGLQRARHPLRVSRRSHLGVKALGLAEMTTPQFFIAGQLRQPCALAQCDGFVQPESAFGYNGLELFDRAFDALLGRLRLDVGGNVSRGE